MLLMMSCLIITIATDCRQTSQKMCLEDKQMGGGIHPGVNHDHGC